SCVGDSGGPLFIDAGGGQVIAGVTSGGFSADCQAPDLSYDADIYVNRDWIALNGQADITASRCGLLPQLGETSADAEFFAGTLLTDARFTVDVPAGTTVLRVGLNAEESDAPNDFDLYLRYGSEPSIFDYDCESIRPGAYEFCQIDMPPAGTWHLLINNFDGDGGAYQLSVTIFAGPVETRSVPAWQALPAGLATLALLTLARALWRRQGERR
ncbi:MAG: trypsin-like serine protease, partial [Gammaproteobacteria bacterium]|nr:trypsin-like serine protease [Gammaproteobacteria bacterium]